MSREIYTNEKCARATSTWKSPESPLKSSPPPKPLTPEEASKIVSVFRTIKDPQAARSPSAEIRDAVQKISPHVAGCKKELLDLLRAEKESTYYRMMLAGMLVSLNETDLTRSVAEEIRNDDFHLFPDSLFRLAYGVARTSPRDAKPLLAQLLKTSGSDIVLPQHAMRMDWGMQLFQAYGVAEMECIDDLVKMAEQQPLPDPRPRCQFHRQIHFHVGDPGRHPAVAPIEKPHPVPDVRRRLGRLWIDNENNQLVAMAAVTTNGHVAGALSRRRRCSPPLFAGSDLANSLIFKTYPPKSRCL